MRFENDSETGLSEVQTLARGLKILDLLASADDGLASGELAEQMGMDKGAMSRLMKTLVSYGYAERDAGSRRYFLGHHLIEISRNAGQHGSLRELATPLLELLNQQTTENAHLAIMQGDHAVTIADVASQQTLRVVSEVGRRLPMHASAVGKCLLAFNELAVPDTLRRYTEQTVCDTTKLMKELESIRLSGQALDNEELTTGVRGFAVPVRNREGRVIASLGISGPTVRLPLSEADKCFELLTTSASTMSEQLGFVASTN